MKKKPTLSVITTTDPAAQKLPLLLETLADLAAKQDEHFEVIIVDDLGQWKKAEHPEVKCFSSLSVLVIQPEERQGQLKAIQQGLMATQARLIITIDPDLYPCVPEIPNMTGLLNEHTLAVHAIRASRPDASQLRILASVIINLAVRKITGLNVKDIGSPITIFDRRVLDMLSTRPCKRQVNPRLHAYMKLGERLSCYKLNSSATARNTSHYNIFELFRIGLELLKDANELRARKKRNELN